MNERKPQEARMWERWRRSGAVGDMDSAKDRVAESFSPRAIGRNWLACFAGHQEDFSGVQSDMASFVNDKVSGERVVAMFGELGYVAKLDFRPFEPGWVQVKLGACDEHAPRLERLQEAVGEGRQISRGIIRQAFGESQPQASTA